MFFFRTPILCSEISNIKDSINLPIHDTMKGRLIGRLAWKLKFENSQESFKLAEKELAIGKKYKNRFLQIDAYRTIGLYNILSKKYIEGLSNYEKSIQLALLDKNYFYLASLNSLIAGVYYDQSEFNTSVSYYYKGLDYALKSKNETVISMIRLNLAAVYTTTNTSLPKAEFLLKSALKADLANEKWAPAALVSGSIAELYAKANKKDSSILYLKFAIQLIQKDTTEPFLNGQVSMTIAGSQFSLKNYNQAEFYSIKGIKIFESINTSLYMLPGYEILTNCAIEKNQLKDAKSYAMKLLNFAIDNKSKVEICNSYELLSKIDKMQGNFKSALINYEKFKSWNDSLTEEKKLERIAQMEFKSLTQLKQKENSILLSQNLRLKKEIKFSILGLICFGIMGGLLFWNINIKNKLYKKLELEQKLVLQQVEDKTILLQEVHHRVKNNLTMINSLLYLQSKEIFSQETKHILEEFQHRIQSIAIVHTKLYDESNISKLDFSSFINSIFDELSRSFVIDNKSIIFNISGISANMDISTAVTLGLIFNELITNSLKYAFQEVTLGNINIHVSETEKKIVIHYSDNGPGLNIGFNENKGNFGFKLLHLLTKQIRGNISYNANKIFILEFPKE